jgi:hypothetical protein
LKEEKIKLRQVFQREEELELAMFFSMERANGCLNSIGSTRETMFGQKNFLCPFVFK